MAQNTAATTLNAALREIVDTRIRKQFQTSTTEYNEFMGKMGPEQVNSRGHWIIVELTREMSNAGLAEGGVLPVPGTRVLRRMNIGYTRYAKGIENTADYIEQIKSKQLSFATLASDMASYRKNIELEFSQLFYGDGSFTKAVVGPSDALHGAITKTGVLNVLGTGDNFFGSVTFAAGRGFATFGAGQVGVGGIYNIINPSNGLARNTGTPSNSPDVTCLRIVGTQMYFNYLPTDTTAGDMLVYANSYGTAYHGMEYHVVAQTGPYQGLYRSGHPTDVLENYPQLRAQVYDALGSELTWGLITYIDEIAVYREDADLNLSDRMIITSPAQLTKANNLGAPLKWYTSGETTLKVGFTGIETPKGGMWKAWLHCPEANVYYLKKSSFAKLGLFPLDLITDGGGNSSFLATTTQGGGRRWAYDSWFGWMGELAGKDPRQNAAIVNLSTTNTIRAYQNTY